MRKSQVLTFCLVLLLLLCACDVLTVDGTYDNPTPAFTGYGQAGDQIRSARATRDAR